MKWKHRVMNPPPRKDAQDRAELRARLGRMYRLGRPLTDREVQRFLEYQERGLVS